MTSLRNVQVFAALLLAAIAVSDGNKLSEYASFYKFIKAVDPDGVLGINSSALELNPCLGRWNGVICNKEKTDITELKFRSMNLSGVIDAESLCQLPKLRVLNLAHNRIHGSVPDALRSCTSLRCLNLGGNKLLSVEVPGGLRMMRPLRDRNVSKKHRQELRVGTRLSYDMPLLVSREGTLQVASDAPGPSPPKPNKINKFPAWIVPVFVIGFFVTLTYKLGRNAEKSAKECEILKALAHTPDRSPAAKIIEEVKPVERPSELVFFVQENERFKLEDLLESAADLQNQTLCSSLYKVMILKNNIVYAVKRIKKLQVSSEEFGETMSRVGALKHPNVLPLVGYNSTDEEKLLIYKFQDNGSLLTLLEKYIEGKKPFPWNHRLSIIWGITKGLSYLHQSFDDEEIIVPHGNLKLSNILLNESEEALISEYGLSQFQDSKRPCPLSAGYRPPEKTLTEQGDVYSFGVIFLELLTSKLVEKSGLDLPKWVRSVVREEWTVEVFDREVNRAGNNWAFPLLNVALKCVSQSPEDRPSMGEVCAYVEKVVKDQTGNSDMSPASSVEEARRSDSTFLHQVLGDSWDTPGSNY